MVIICDGHCFFKELKSETQVTCFITLYDTSGSPRDLRELVISGRI